MRNRIVHWATLLLSTAAGAAANTFDDSFDDGSMNASLWQPYHEGLPFAAEKNGRLELVIPAESTGPRFSAGWKSLPRLFGNFDVTVDFNHIAWPANNGVRTAIAVSAGYWYYNLERTCWNTSGGEVICSDTINGIIMSAPYGSTQGHLRLTRTGGTVTGFFFNGAGWTPLDTLYNSPEGLSFSIWTWAHDYTFGHRESVATFDNFRAVDQGALVSGHIALGDFGDPEGQPVTLETRVGGQVVDSQTIALGPGGAYEAAVGPFGQAVLYVRGSHWLYRAGPPLSLVPNGHYIADFALVNGDIDRSNSVDIGDYSVLSLAFATFEGDPNWNAQADLDGNGAIDIGDYAILSANFGTFGDD